jgi:hypothetical protein
MVASRTTGWSLSTDQIALRMSGARRVGSDAPRTTSDIAASPKGACAIGT